MEWLMNLVIQDLDHIGLWNFKKYQWEKNMKHLIFMLFLFSCTYVIAEVNKQTGINLYPQNLIHQSDSSKYYECSLDNINQATHDTLFKFLESISTKHGMAKPMKKLCTLSTFEGFGAKTYSVNFYINGKSMKKCMYENNCNDFRSVTYVVKNNEIMLQAMVSNASIKKVHNYCSSSKGVTDGFCK